MGRGDRKTRKGKTAIRSYGNVRSQKKATAGTGKPVVKKSAATKTAAAPAKRPATGAARPSTGAAKTAAAPKKKA